MTALDPRPHPAAALWPAPEAPGTLDTVVEVPGSKSLSNRYLVLAALADGPSRLRAVLSSRDTRLMGGALETLGVTVDAGQDWVVSPAALRGHVTIDCGLAGTVMRFLPAVAALADGPVHFKGDPEALVRPMGPIIQALRALGVRVDEEGEPGHLPITVHGRGHVRGGQVDVDASGSSQFVSGLLLAGARFEQGLTIRHTGRTLPSLPHIEMTVDVLRAAGVDVDDSRPDIWRVAPGAIAGRDVRVEPDLSNAGAFLAAALVAGGTVRVPGWPTTTTQPGGLLPGILERMGATTRLDGDVLAVTGTGVVHGVDLDLKPAGELAPTIAALAVFGDGPTRLRGIAHLRGHETDRLAALANEITRLGGQAEQTADGLVITPRALTGGVWRTYADHRMATAGALVGLRVPGVEVEDVATTGKTLPDFVGMWQGMLGTRPAGTGDGAQAS
ncbi:3-phosphoshikimate 1-carboxyvinyltransferase [Cellulomonas biazotea]|uniref:3-phosphoshikimate 1-carboxyvinyltransferase n=1 Tax=Cellulomonas biazotea TaxID=1709 RepID=A0A402DLI1_9CELL|nr:3-phosphoshikimate 1-carboxyvinyltransferase [Cellulomonas biazotea]GCE74983.1 3-phosphoshikimate 1-carboxyvinyltransferase 1 [Cellulomonas biazotea]